jgi:hypothetical protein
MTMNWRVKGLIQGTLSYLPAGEAVNDWLQLKMGMLRDFDGNVEGKVIRDWAVLLSHMHELGVSPEGKEYLEVGTGWYPTLPVCFFLAGARSCRTYDIKRHISEELTFKMLCSLERHLPAVAAAARRPLEEIRSEYQGLRSCGSLEQLLKRARIEYIAPGDATSTALPARSVDVVFSSNVLEHVPRATILRLLEEGRRVLRPGGLAIHSANCGDHFAYFDSKITPINYLSYSDRDWRFWNNDLLYQNRMRPSDFIELAREAQLDVVLYKFRERPDLLPALRTMQLAPEFRDYPAEQLCSTSVAFVAQAR